MSCRTGPLRAARPLRGVCTDLARIISKETPVGRPEHREDPRGSPHRDKIYPPRSGRAARSGPVRQGVSLERVSQ
jgi:hypothetical protein